MKILIVEDEPSTQKLYSCLFGRKSGCTVLFAEDVESSQRLLDEHNDIDVVTLDGELNNNGRGQDVAEYIVGTVWPRQERAKTERTAFVTLSGMPYEVEGMSASYCKPDFPSIVLKGGVTAWIAAMKTARPPARPEKKEAMTFDARAMPPLTPDR